MVLLRRCGGHLRRCGGHLRRCGGPFEEMWWSFKEMWWSFKEVWWSFKKVWRSSGPCPCARSPVPGRISARGLPTVRSEGGATDRIVIL